MDSFRTILRRLTCTRKTIDAYVSADNIRLDSLRDTRKCPAVPAKAKAESGLVCYTPADLRKKDCGVCGCRSRVRPACHQV